MLKILCTSSQHGTSLQILFSFEFQIGGAALVKGVVVKTKAESVLTEEQEIPLLYPGVIRIVKCLMWA